MSVVLAVILRSADIRIIHINAFRKRWNAVDIIDVALRTPQSFVTPEYRCTSNRTFIFAVAESYGEIH